MAVICDLRKEVCAPRLGHTSDLINDVAKACERRRHGFWIQVRITTSTTDMRLWQVTISYAFFVLTASAGHAKRNGGW